VGLVGRKIFDQNRDIVDAAAEFFRQRIQDIVGDFNKIFSFHPSSPTARHPQRVGAFVVALVIFVVVFLVLFLFVFFLIRFFPKANITRGKGGMKV